MRNDKGQFIKGNRGKPKGSKHRATRNLRQALEAVASGSVELLTERLNELSNRELIQLLSATSKHILPTLSSIDADVNTSGGWVSLTKDQKAEIIKEHFSNATSEN